MLDGPFEPWPQYSEEEVEAVAHVIRSGRVNYWTGQECRQFEKEFAAWAGTNHAIALANGTLALDVALRALDIGRGDEVIVTPRSFIASVSCVINAGATPVFADVDINSGNLSAETIAAVITDRTKAVIPVHLGGWPCDMDAIMAITSPRGIHVIEDCAQAHGAKVGDRMVGSIGTIGAWSFCQDKIMSTGGEGGMVTTNDADLWSKMWSYKDHGKDYDAVYNRQHPPGFRWVHEHIGTNWRMLEVQAVIGRIQLRRMAEITARRSLIANAIAETLAPFEQLVRVPSPAQDVTHAHYRQYGYVRADGFAPGWDRERLIAEINARGVPLFHGPCSEIYLEKAFDNTPFRPLQRLPVARELGETSLMFLTDPVFTDDQVAKMQSVVHTVFTEAAR